MSKGPKPEIFPVQAQKTMAKEAGVSEGTFYNYMKLKESADPELLDKVRRGEMKIGAARRKAGLDLAERLKDADGRLKFISDCVPFKNNPEINKEIKNRLGKIASQIENILREARNA